ncbi:MULTISPECIES: crotonase/enoyl-CoA hydratase family protein [unclassified Sphingobium]|jgi:enoyl-CoA hydratase/carnithine racemase|uniref:crotonase/enoyl-CoA hydratase family protein n=1 Tax=unclassified Sphingobium TaxID=2611147 RepID=UPI000C568277|nr:MULTISPECIES: crotonase/enoyl-CoA hydratase family protein [unclassified Sphingobium]MBS89692.1 enoyl-CoA hydratase [Sphingobium sp.]
MTEPLILAETQDHVTTITLNAPDLRNPISDLATVNALIDALMAADVDQEVRAVILTGAGSAFSSGGNIKTMRPGKGLRGHSPQETIANYRAGIQRIPLAFASLEVPVIAAVNGPAIGAGLDLACMCDVRLAAASARFAESFVKLGIVPGDGGAWLLRRIVGESKAMEMSLTGDMIDAAEALRIGLVSRVVDDGELMAEARALAGRIAANPPGAVRMTKKLIRIARTDDIAALLDASAAMQAAAHETSDHAEAVSAFLDKRRPLFTGR